MYMAHPIPAGPDLLIRLRQLIEAGRSRAARTMLNAARRLPLPGSEVAELEARLLGLEGRAPEACAVLDAAIAADPGEPALHMARAAARERVGDLPGATLDAAEAVVLAPGMPHPKAMLGALLNQLGRHADARACLEEAVAAAPDDGNYWQQLAAAHDAAGDTAAASRSLAEGIARAPGSVALRTSAILARMRAADFAGAEALALAACRDGVADACVLGLLGHARSSLGRHAEAAEAYAEARRMAPEDPYVAHLAAAGGLAPDAARASTDYVRVVFDGYAERFDRHLITLGYRIPGVIRAELAATPPPPGGPAGPVLDLGCGTGLLAVAAADSGWGPWIGVDLSAGMLREAARRGLYAALHEADVVDFLAAETRAFPVMLAGDVVPYFGDLAPLLGAAAARLAPGGRLLFSAEWLPDAEAAGRPWRLGRLARYAHTRGYLAEAAAAAGLTVAALREETVRLEVGVPVPGLFAILRRDA